MRTNRGIKMAFSLGAAEVDIKGNTKGLKASMGTSRKLLGGLGKGAIGAAAKIAAVVAAFWALKKAVVAVTAAYNKQIEAETKLNAALEATGQTAQSADLKAFAAELQLVTRMGDEATLELLAYGVQMGLTAEQAKEAAKASIGLAAGLEGVEPTMAMRAISKEMQGVTSSLNDSIPALKGVEDAHKRLTIIQEAAANGMKTEIAQTKTLGGQWEQTKGIFGDSLENIGKMFESTSGGIVAGLKDLAIWFQGITEVVLEFGTHWGDNFNWIGKVFSSTVSFIGKVIKEAMFLFLNWDLVIESLGNTFVKIFGTIGEVVKNGFGNVMKTGEWFFDNWKDIFATVFDFTSTVFINMGKNIRNFFTNLWQWIKTRGSEGFEDGFVGLTEGFKSTIKKMPEFDPLVSDNFNQMMNKMDKDLQKKWDKRRVTFEGVWDKAVTDKFDPKKRTEKEKAALEKASKIDLKGKADIKVKADKASFGSLTKPWEDAMKKSIDKDNVPKAQLKVAEKGNMIAEAQLAEQKKMAKNQGLQ
jgi:hypothetical protein